ncbi:CHAT domain-containing protein, partial [uncultured Planktosalinus sp.]|uniref:CHAT domain-containing protein n=1 Tax=uncultured Planktosalinus sp. TaxID=1810935 RepID=UPI0030DBB643
YLGALTDLSTNHRNHRNYTKALGYLNKAIQEYETNKERIHSEVMHHLGIKKELDFFHSLIILHRNAGDEAAMLATFEQVETLVANTDTDATEKGMYKSIIESVVRYYTIHHPRPERAEHYIQKGLALQTESSTIFRNDGPTVLLINRARVLMHQKEYSNALNILEDLVHPDLTIGKKVILNELMAVCHLGLEQPEAASLAINQFLVLLSEDNESFGFPESAASDFHPGSVLGDAEALVHLAQAWHTYKGGYSPEEELLYRLAMRQFKHALGNQILNKGLKEYFDLIVSGLLEAALEHPFSEVESNELLSFIETVKSQNLINSFLLNRELAGTSELYLLVEQEQLIRSQLTRLKKKLQEQEEDEVLQQQLFDKNLELEALQQQLTDSYQEFNDFTTAIFSLKEYNGGPTVQFIVANGQLYKLSFRNHGVTYAKIDAFTELKATLTTFVKDISNPKVPIETLKSRGATLYRQLFPEGTDSDGSLTVIPDGMLHYLPFELLVKDGRYLIEDLAIAYAPNLTFVNINSLKDSDTHSTTAAYFAPEYSAAVSGGQLAVRGTPYALPGAMEEVNELSQLVPGKLYTGTAASKQQFKSLDTDVAILHLAMHSNLNDEDPEL